jgi:signal peptidase I
MFGGSRKRYQFYPEERSGGGRVLQAVKLLILLFLLYELVSTFLVTSYRVETNGMQPVFELGDRVIVTSLPLGADLPLLGVRGPAIGSPKRGDLVVAASRLVPDGARLLAPVDSAVRFFTGRHARLGQDDWRPEIVVRRVIAVPGDTVRMEDYIFYVRPADAESYGSEFEVSGVRYPLRREDPPAGWGADFPFGGNMEPVELAEGQYFLAGDNRTAALDSRHRGPANAKDLRARVLMRYWPVARFGVPGR